MDVQEAVRQAQAHIQNAMELTKQPIMKADLLYQWDNQITSLDNFLAETEVLSDALLEKARGSMRVVKKQLTDSVIKYEAAQEGIELEDEPEPSEDEWAESFIDQAYDLLDMLKEVVDEKVTDIKDLAKWEDPLAIVNGFLADSEPFQDANKDLRKVRSIIRAARRDLQHRIADLIAEWKKTAEKDDD